MALRRPSKNRVVRIYSYISSRCVLFYKKKSEKFKIIIMADSLGIGGQIAGATAGGALGIASNAISNAIGIGQGEGSATKHL